MHLLQRIWLCLKHSALEVQDTIVGEDISISNTAVCRKSGKPDLTFYGIPVYVGQDVCIARYYDVLEIPCIENIPLLIYRLVKTSLGTYHPEIYTTSEFGRLGTLHQRALLYHQVSMIDQNIEAHQVGLKFNPSVKHRMVADRYATQHVGIAEYVCILTSVVEDMEAIDAMVCEGDKPYSDDTIAEYEHRISEIKSLEHS